MTGNHKFILIISESLAVGLKMSTPSVWRVWASAPVSFSANCFPDSFPILTFYAKPGYFDLKYLTNFVAVQSLSRVQLFVTPWTEARQASLSFTSPGACSNSCPLGQWCHLTILSSVTPFSSCSQSFSASGSFPMSMVIDYPHSTRYICNAFILFVY